MRDGRANEFPAGRSNGAMKRVRVVVPWQKGLHIRPAARLVRIAQRFRSTISVACGGKIADLRSVLSILTLCATMGTALDVRANGEDESDAAAAVEAAFSTDDGDDSAPHVTRGV